MDFNTKSSGKKESFESGMHRDVQTTKPRFDLLIPKEEKYDETMLYRWQMLMLRGQNHYGDRNWELANSVEEMERFKMSAFRHFMQWFSGETDEDHAQAIFFNVNGVEHVKVKLNKKK